MGKRKEKEEKLIVSMTSFPAAIEYAQEAVKSLLKSNLTPDKIILYLTFSQFGEEGLPLPLLKLQEENPVFEIRDYPHDIRSYRKLIPALLEFPEDVIVTVDDDVIYHPDMLKQLMEMHSLYPKDVIAHRARKIKPDSPYKKWKKYRWYHFLNKKYHEDILNLQTGVGGVLYPPHSLKEEMLDPEIFTKLAPTTDDIWFWAATVSNRRKVIPVPFGQNKPKSLEKPKSISLKTTNFKDHTDKNIAAFNEILKTYPEIRRMIAGAKD